MKMRIALCLSLAAGCSSWAHAEVVTYHCTFPSYSDPSGLWDQKGFGFDIMYDNVSQNAFMVGNLGMSPASTLVGGDSPTFLEITAMGNVMVTAIAQDGVAAHSRHTVIAGSLHPSQHYGTCVVGSSG